MDICTIIITTFVLLNSTRVYIYYSYYNFNLFLKSNLVTKQCLCASRAGHYELLSQHHTRLVVLVVVVVSAF